VISSDVPVNVYGLSKTNKNPGDELLSSDLNVVDVGIVAPAVPVTETVYSPAVAGNGFLPNFTRPKRSSVPPMNSLSAVSAKIFFCVNPTVL
jgi:hypothetical protein